MGLEVATTATDWVQKQIFANRQPVCAALGFAIARDECDTAAERVAG
jgi:hypothetical protein